MYRQILKYSVIVLPMVLTVISCSKKDTEAPVITLNGDAYINVSLNGTFSDPGATATDNKDGNLIVTVSGEVNPGFAGIYYLNYSASDAAGNTAGTYRTVNVTNNSAIYNGTYQLYTTTSTDTVSMPAYVLSSTSVNKRIWITSYGMLSNASVYCDISGDTLNIPMQSAIAGNPAAEHYFSGFGSLQLTNDTIMLYVSFRDSTTASVISGISIYKKQ